jgi:hypothetical protein
MGLPGKRESKAVIVKNEIDVGTLSVGTVSVTDITPGTAAANLGKAEDAAHTSGDVGVMALAVRHDAGGSLGGTTGDYVPLQVDSSGLLRTTATVTGGSGTSMTDDAAFTVGTTSITPVGGTYKSVRDAVDDNDAGALAMNAKRGVYVTLETSASVETGVAAAPLQVSLANTAANATAVKVDGSAVTQPVSAASLPLPTGASTLAEQQTQTASLSVMDDWDESDRAKVNTIAGQAGVAGGSGTVSALTQRVVLATDVALPAGTNAIGKLSANSGVDIGDVDVTSIVPGTGATSLGKAEDAAHTTGDVGVMMLGVETTQPQALLGLTGTTPLFKSIRRVESLRASTGRAGYHFIPKHLAADSILVRSILHQELHLAFSYRSMTTEPMAMHSLFLDQA